MTIFASYLELTHKFSNYGKRADLSEKGEEMKRSFGCYKISSYGKRADFSEDGLKRVIFA